MFGILGKSRNITRIALTPPKAAPAREGLAIVLIVRNEAVHVAEWARFHAAAGVRHFHVYDNGSSDGTVEAMVGAVGSGMVTALPWDQKLRDARSGAEIHNQVLAYAHATRNFGGSYRWMSYVDVDEFLVPKRAANLPEALAHLGEERNISLPWHMFGRNGHDKAPAGGVVKNYTRRNPNPMSDARGLRNFKMIVDPCHVTAIRVHSIETDGSSDSANDRGNRTTASGRDAADFYSADHIQLNHYYTRSDAELRSKIERGPNLTTPDADHLRRVMRKVENIEAGEIEDLSAVEFLERIGVK